MYGRRKGAKLSAHQTRLVETLLPQLRLDLRENADPREYFAADVEEVWFEIGFGAGEHLLWQAQHNPNVGIIGAEPYESGVAKLLSRLYAISAPLFPSPAHPGLAPGGAGEVPNAQFAREAEGAGARGDTPPPPSRPSGSTPPPLAARSREREQESLSPDSGALRGKGNLLGRIRLYTGDARDIIGGLPDASLGRIFLLFPDPWPKKRHHKRRFIQMGTLDALARVMKPGAEFRFASDDPTYVAWTLERVIAHHAFAWLAQRPSDWLLRPPDWPATRYEQKALHGKPVFLGVQRTP